MYKSGRKTAAILTNNCRFLKLNHIRSFQTSHILRQQHNANSQYPSYIEPMEDEYRSSKERTPLNLGVVIVPQQKAYVIERFGRYVKVLEPGLNFLIPFVDTVSYVHSLKEDCLTMTKQHAITRDNVTIEIDGVLYLRIIDPEKASYGVSDPLYAVSQLAQTTMRSELGKMTLDKTFEERENLNTNIMSSLNMATEAWGVTCLRYEIKDIKPPANVRQAMEMQAEAERRKRAQILESEAEQQSAINLANGQQQARVLEATGEAKAIELRAEATAKAVRNLAVAISDKNGQQAVALRVAEQYMTAFGNIAKEGNTMLLPAETNNPASMITQALGIYKNISGQIPVPGGGKGSSDYNDDIFIGAPEDK